MPSSKRRLLIFKKVSSFLRNSILAAQKSTRAIFIPRLALLRRTGKLRNLKLAKRYDYNYNSSFNYRFLQEYEFSPSSSPDRVPPPRYRNKYLNRRRFGGDWFFFCSCLSGMKGVERSFLALPETGGDDVTVDALGEEDSVDMRAEMFIRRFYEEMRMQTQQSI